MLPPCGAAALTDSNVKGGVEDEPGLTCLCVAASAAANGNKAIRKVAIGIILMIHQLCRPLCVPASSSIRTYTARRIDFPGARKTDPGLRDNEPELPADEAMNLAFQDKMVARLQELTGVELPDGEERFAG